MNCPVCGAALPEISSVCLACGEQFSPPLGSDRTENLRRPFWVTNPSPRVKLIVLMGTIWHVVYATLFLAAMIIGICIQVSTGMNTQFPGNWIWIIGPVHMMTIAIGFALLAFYGTFLFRTPRFPTRHQVIWMFLFLCFGGFSMLVFWRRHLRPAGTVRRFGE